MTGVSPAVLFGLRCGNPHHPKSGEVYGINPEWQHLARLTNDGCSELVVSHDGGVTWTAAPRGGAYLTAPEARLQLQPDGTYEPAVVHVAGPTCCPVCATLPIGHEGTCEP